MKQISITIDGKILMADEGQSILWAALDNGIYIPNLCAIREKDEPSASCRLCFVEIEGKPYPVPACAEKVAEGMVVTTAGQKARRLARTALELLLASHNVDCKNCSANGSCELQKAAKHLEIKLSTKRFKKILKDIAPDESSLAVVYDPNKCVLCGRCVWMCANHGTGTIGFAHRGFDRMVTTFGDQPLVTSSCTGCADCISVCPVGALSLKK